MVPEIVLILHPLAAALRKDDQHHAHDDHGHRADQQSGVHIGSGPHELCRFGDGVVRA